MINIDEPSSIEMIEIPIEKINWTQLPNQEYYSWDNRKESILRSNYKYYEVSYKGQVESFFIINVDKEYVTQFDVFVENPDAWIRLFAGISQLSKPIRTNNVDDRLIEKIEILSKVGLNNPADQYEMTMEL